jgi:hypothetical protein
MALVVLAVGAIVAQPRDDAELRRFFTAPDGCSAPCFLGIRPGATTWDEAGLLLAAHPWVTVLRSNSENIWWAWDDVPPTFARHLNSESYVARIDFRGGVVERIFLPTAVRFGDFLALFGAQDQIVTTKSNSPSTVFLVQDSIYLDQGFAVETTARCPLKSRKDLWYGNTFITWATRDRRLDPGIWSC